LIEWNCATIANMDSSLFLRSCYHMRKRCVATLLSNRSMMLELLWQVNQCQCIDGQHWWCGSPWVGWDHWDSQFVHFYSWARQYYLPGFLWAEVFYQA
jgi:hypothetical protein